MANKPMKRYSKSLAISRIKKKKKHHNEIPLQTKQSGYNKRDVNNCWLLVKLESLYISGGYIKRYIFVGKVLQCFKMLNRATIQPSNSIFR